MNTRHIVLWFAFAGVLLVAESGPTLPAIPAGTAASTSKLPQIKIRVGLSRRLLQAINETDGRNILLANAQNTGAAMGMDVQFAAGGFMDGADLAQAIAHGEVDLATMPADEFARLPHTQVRSEVLTAFAGGKCDEEYLLLVRKDSPYRSLAALVNRRLNVQQSIKSHLALLWLDYLTRQSGLGPAETVFPTMRIAAKPSQVILPVFFGQADAAIATRHSLEVLAELNPGVARELEPIAVSPRTVSAILCFRSGASDELVARTLASIRHMRATPMGRQALTLFQIDQFDVAPADVLTSTCALVAAHDNLVGSGPAARANAMAGRPGTETP